MHLLELLRFLFSKLIQSSLKPFLIYFTLTTISAPHMIATLFLFKEIIDTASGNVSILSLSLTTLVILYFLLLVFSNILDSIRSHLWAICQANLTRLQLSEFIQKISSLDLAQYENNETTTTIQRTSSRINFQVNNSLRTIFGAYRSGIELIISTGIFIFAAPLATFLIIFANAISIFAQTKISRGTFQIYRADTETRRRYGYLMDMIMLHSTLPEIKLFNSFDFFKKRILDLYNNYTTNQLRADRKALILATSIELLPYFTLAGFTFVIVSNLSNNLISVGEFAFLFTNIFVFNNALGRTTSELRQFATDSHYLSDMLDFYKLRPTIKFNILADSTTEKLLHKLYRPTISIENLAYHYPKNPKPVFNNLTLHIPYGQNLAIVGENGAGKTTLIKLLLRMYEPQQGDILFNNINIREIPQQTLYNLFSILFQDFGRFYLTLRENIELVTNKKLSDRQVIELFQKADFIDFVNTLPHKFDQQLGAEYNQGVELSGGQWQKLGIARSFARNTPIIILDEPTSALDARAEMQIFDNLNTQTQDKTLIFVSHRFSTIKDAQRIIVLDRGAIIEDGTHQELLNLKGKYANLYNLQAQRYHRN
jgi:ATP-binding cassette subfamily B protein